jgi:hypothetical protein
MPAGLGGGGWVAISLETAMGVYQPPVTAGTVWVPILDESFVYTEDKYYSPQIRQQTIVSDVQQSYYHIEGDIHMEADPNFLPYFLYCSRHNITKTGAAAPFVYKFTPGSQGSVFTGTGANARTASITVVRNGVGFGYAGCVAAGYEFTLDNGVLLVTFNMLGLSETDVGSLGTPVWVDPKLFGAASHSIFVAASAVTPTWTSNNVNFNGFTFTANFNGAAQNRVVPNRAATYISFGETEANYNTELDFIDKTEYTNYKNASTRAVKLESLRNAAVDFATATEAFRIQINRTAYDSYTVPLSGMGDLIMATTTGRAIGIAGGSAYAIEVKTSVDIV